MKWRWEKPEKDAFNNLKDVIGTEGLKLYGRYLVVQMDTSGVGVGTTILQRNEKGFLQPIAYASRILNKAGRNYPQIERELLGVVFHHHHHHHFSLLGFSNCLKYPCLYMLFSKDVNSFLFCIVCCI